jgi:hypothetical protein
MINSKQKEKPLSLRGFDHLTVNHIEQELGKQLTTNHLQQRLNEQAPTGTAQTQQQGSSNNTPTQHDRGNASQKQD